MKDLSKSRGSKRSYKSIRKQAWDLQSKRIRMEETRCVTCGSDNQLQAGHFIHGDSLDFEPTNIHSQCVRCNKFLHGNLIEYTLFMQRTYGQEEIDRLKNLKKLRSRGYKIPESTLFEIIDKEKKRIYDLESSKED